MNKDKFYEALRQDLFKRGLNQANVDGINALLEAGKGLPLHHMANVLAQVYHETGGRMSPVRETFANSDSQAISRLESAFKAGRLPWVKTPYWRKDASGNSWYGRGQIQITHRDNYLKFGITNPNDALKPDVSARVAVEGMRDGKFTGRKLADYNFPSALDLPPDRNPRRIVNGRDGTDSKVAGHHRHFADALQQAGWGATPALAPTVNTPWWLEAILKLIRGIKK